MPSRSQGFGWFSVLRVGVVQACLGAMVVLMTSTLNRVLVVELALPATIPGALVALHFTVQMLGRPLLGHRSDTARRTPWIVGGLGVLTLSGTAAAWSATVMLQHRTLGLLLAATAFTGIGAGVSAAGTPLLALLAEEVAAPRRARAAALVWICMIAGFVVTTVIASEMLTPFSFDRLTAVVALIGATALGCATLALWRLEPPRDHPHSAVTAGGAFTKAVGEVWSDPSARLFAWFVFWAMLAYSAQDLILEPFAGAVFGFTPAESTRLSSVHQGGMLLGMLSTAALALRFGALRTWAAGGCAASAVAFVLLAFAPSTGSSDFLRGTVLILGLANGAFAIGAVGSMIALAGSAPRPGLRMGVFGAAQAIAYAIGGFAGAAGSDVARSIIGSPSGGYVTVFAVEAGLFAVAAALAFRAGALGSARLALAGAGSGDRVLSVMG